MFWRRRCSVERASRRHRSRSAARRSYDAQLAESPVTPPVALVVPAFNEQHAIVATVLSLMDLQYPEKEIIVVDDGSTDETVQNLIEFEKAFSCKPGAPMAPVKRCRVW